MIWIVSLLVALATLISIYLASWRFRSRALEAREKADILTVAIEQSPAVVGICGIDGNLQYVNPTFEAVSGYSARELLGRNPRILNAGLTSPDDFADLWQTITLGGVWKGEFCNRRKDGQLYWERATVASVTDSKGAISHYLKVAEDITESRKAAQALDAIHRRFRSVFELSGAGITFLDRQGRCLQVNDHLCEILEYPRDELEGRSIFDLTIEDDQRVDIGWSIPFENEGQKSTTIEKRCLTRSGRQVWMEVTTTLQRDDQGVPEYYICMFTDISRRRQAEEAASRQQSQMAHLTRVHTLQHMAGELAHEIDQPLCAILTAAQASLRLLDSAGDQESIEDARTAMRLVADQATRAGAVVDSIRQFTRKKPAESKIFEVAYVIDEALNLMSAELLSQGVEVRRSDDDIPSPLILGDPTLMTQVMVNLCRNGAKAMMADHEDSRTLTVGWSLAQDLVRIHVHNTGHAIGEELIDKIFAPFFSTQPEGLGLGLPLSRSIVESNGGRLWVEPGVEGGTTFLIELPTQKSTAMGPKGDDSK